MYYNTNSLFGEELKEAVKVTNNQDELCLEVFRKHQCSFSACQVWRILVKTGKIDKNVPATSIRRSITDLKNKGLLVKTDTMITGLFGKNVHTYKLK